MDTIFISYSHQDEDWKDRVQSHLSVLENHGKLTIWDDRKIPLGGDWLDDIEQSLEQANIALLLVSVHFLNSNFIRNKEIPRLLQRREQDGLKVIPVLLSACSWEYVDWLSSIQMYPRDNKPLKGMTEHQADEALAKLTSHLPQSTKLNEISIPETLAEPLANEAQNVVINNFSGITLERYEEGLRRQEKRLREEFGNLLGKNNPDKEKLLTLELETVQSRLLNLQSSYRETLARLEEADDALEQLKDELPELQVEKARELLAKNDKQEAKQAFGDIVAKGSPSVALAAYESARLEEEDINYHSAMKMYSLAVSLEEENLEYLSAAGKMAYTLGKYSIARDLFSNLLKILQPSNTDLLGLATCQFDLAKVYKESGEYQKAESLYRNSLNVFEKKLQKNHPTIAVLSNNLAELYRLQGKHTKAEELYQRAIAIYRDRNIEDPEYASALNNLAELHRLEGRSTEAKPLYEKSLSIYEKCLGKDHPYVATLLNNLALIYVEHGKHSKAVLLFKRSIAIIEKTLGKQHHLFANALNNLADLYRTQGNYSEAESLYLHDLSITEKTLGNEHPDFATTLNNLGKLYLEQGKTKKAKSLFRRSLDINERALGKDHPNVAAVLSNLSFLLSKEGKLPASIKYLQKAVFIWEQKLPSSHPNLITARKALELLTTNNQ